MLNILVEYLRQKADAMDFIAVAYGLAEMVDRKDGDENKSYPAVYSKGELVQVSFDTKPSLVFFMLDGEVKRETNDGETSSCEDQVTETYKLKLFFFNAGKELSDCASITQQAAYSIAKFFNSDNTQLETALNLQEVRITTTSFNFNKKNVWEDLHNNIPFSLSERQQLCSIDFDVFINGVESCFVVDPCQNSDYTYTNTLTSFCERVADCSPGVFSIDFYGNNTDRITKAELIGKEILMLSTDGIIRKKSTNTETRDYTPNSPTGETVFSSVVFDDQLINVLYK